MKKIKSKKELELEHKAKENFNFLNKYQTNPFDVKFSAFVKTKKEIKPKDLF